MGKLKTFFSQCLRVWKVLKRPTGEEFKNIAKVSAIGIAIIGIVGFIVGIIFTLLLK